MIKVPDLMEQASGFMKALEHMQKSFHPKSMDEHSTQVILAFDGSGKKIEGYEVQDVKAVLGVS